MKARKVNSAGYVHGTIDLDDDIMEAAVSRLSEVYSSGRGRKIFVRSNIPVSMGKRDNSLTYWYSFGFRKADGSAGKEVLYRELNPLASAGMDVIYNLPNGEGIEFGVLAHLEIKKRYPNVYKRFLEMRKTPKRITPPKHMSITKDLCRLLDVDTMDGILMRKDDMSPMELYMPAAEKALRVLDYAGGCKP